ncbi:uncharacterized protein J7T54_001506 [Emericellopsis cladophorae]|uniref:Dynamin N-terminal domain-containing protein n=1 Tax=Emericellopsis cladophorae TaxID=2686198 RepID=A0A9P9Y0X0_9HYPO|nr:uncharacterized protein J7T54_001506 [Emericellopsis cladophorae]KAI6781543.1 hypothetical protein J7T54_001506 [Emericellopsis cladophorae]
MGLLLPGRGFSNNVLCLELEGPEMYPLTIIDFPGIFSNTTELQNSDDKKMVDELVDSYIQQRNSIILVIIVAGEVTNQRISFNG